MKMLLLLLLALSVTATPTSTQFAAGERTVVLRIDDIQDYQKLPHFADPEYTVLQYQLDNRIPALLAVIAADFGTNQLLVNMTKIGVKAGLFEIGIHGWHHVAITNQSEAQQTAEMKLAENKLSSIFGIQILAFIPPGGRYNPATIEAMQATGLTLMSADMSQKGVHPGEVATDGIAYFPETAETSGVNQTTKTWVPNPMQAITAQISASWSSYGVAIVVIHPRQFVDASGNWSNDKWGRYVQMIDWIKANQGKFVLPEAPGSNTQSKNQTNLNSFLIPVALTSGIISSLLIALGLRIKRTRNRLAYQSSPDSMPRRGS